MEQFNINKKGLRVEIKHRENDADYNSRQLESGIRLLKKMMVLEGVSKELRTREYHKTKGMKRREAKKNASKREKKRIRDQAILFS